MIKVSDYLVKRVKELTEINHVFMLTGGMAMHIIDSFGKEKDIKVVPMHHEQAAGIAANAYGRMKNIPGVCVVTAGPGATNAVTPCAGAFMESNPMIFISGQVSRKNSKGVLPIRQKGIQEVDIVSIVGSITKYSVQITEPSTIKYHLEKAYYYAVNGRPGPVWIDIPVDVQGAMVEEEKMNGFTPSYAEKSMNGNPVTEQRVDAVIEKINKAKRPLLVLGQGVRLSGAAGLVNEFVNLLGIPVQTTWNGMDLIPFDNTYYYGRANLFGMRYANIIIQNADLILCIGARMGMQHTGYNIEAFARDAEIIMVDVDSGEMEKPDLDVSLKIRSDARDFISKMCSKLKLTNQQNLISEWVEYCNRIKSKYPRSKKIEEIKDDLWVDPSYFICSLTQNLPTNSVIPYGSSGMSHTLFGGNYYLKEKQRAFCFKGLAAMGYGLPCTVGAAFAQPESIVFTLIGEGGLQLNLQELQTIKHHNLPVKVIVFNNGGYHSIHMTQTNLFQKNFVGSGPESDVTFPPLDGLAQLYGFEYYCVRNNNEIDAGLKGLCSNMKPAFLEVMIDPAKSIDPKIISYQLADGTMESRPLEDMSPLIERDELQKDMFIPLIS